MCRINPCHSGHSSVVQRACMDIISTTHSYPGINSKHGCVNTVISDMFLPVITNTNISFHGSFKQNFVFWHAFIWSVESHFAAGFTSRLGAALTVQHIPIEDQRMGSWTQLSTQRDSSDEKALYFPHLALICWWLWHNLIGSLGKGGKHLYCGD